MQGQDPYGLHSSNATAASRAEQQMAVSLAELLAAALQQANQTSSTMHSLPQHTLVAFPAAPHTAWGDAGRAGPPLPAEGSKQQGTDVAIVLPTQAVQAYPGGATAGPGAPAPQAVRRVAMPEAPGQDAGQRNESRSDAPMGPVLEGAAPVAKAANATSAESKEMLLRKWETTDLASLLPASAAEQRLPRTGRAAGQRWQCGQPQPGRRPGRSGAASVAAAAT